MNIGKMIMEYLFNGENKEKIIDEIVLKFKVPFPVGGFIVIVTFLCAPVSMPVIDN